jgi:hypothetical protein
MLKPGSQFGVATLVVVAALLLIASPVSAAPAWLSPVDLSAAGDGAGQPQVAVDPAGNAIAIWNHDDEGFSMGVVESAFHPVGGTWSEPTKLSSPGAGPFGPQIAVDPAGNAIAIWFSFNSNAIETASRPVGGGWSAPIKLSARGANIGARVVFDRTGNAVAIWERSDGIDSFVETASRPVGGDWSAPVAISAAPTLNFAERPQIALDPSGNAVAIWDRINRPDSRFIETTSRPVGGDWSAPVKLSPPGAEAFSPQIGVDSAGNAVATWLRANGEFNVILESAFLPLGGNWSAPVPVSATDHDVRQSQLAVDPAGNAVAIWQRFSRTESIVETAARPAGGDWSEATLLSVAALSGTGTDVVQPQIALDPSGNAAAIWERSTGRDSSIVETAARPAGSDWSRPVELSAASGLAFEPQIALDPSGGHAVAVWAHFNATNSAIQAAAFDGAGPKLQGLVIPARGRARTRLRFAVSALDSWSPLGPVSWRFGDRKRAGGLNAVHVYAKPRRYRLTLEVADALGNATSTAATIGIAAPVKVAHLARVDKGKARLALHCPRPAKLPCKGVAQLSLRRGKKKLKLGQGPFRVAGAKRKTLAIKLSAKARRLLAAAGPKGLAVSLSGDGLGRRTLRLR